MIDRIVPIVSGLKGVLSTALLKDEDRNVILGLESDYEKAQSIKLVNSGVRSVLARGNVLAVLKDSSFRIPPFPTVLLVEEIIDDDESDHVCNLDGKNYRIVGEELFDDESIEEEHVHISSGFVLYPGRREGRSSIPSYFLMPSIGFQELEELKDALLIDNIISASPSSLSDDYIRNTYRFPLNNQLATILIGFDIKGS